MSNGLFPWKVLTAYIILRTEEPCESENFQGYPKTFELLISGILALLYNFRILVSFPLGLIVSIWRKLLYKTVLFPPLPPQKREMVGDMSRILIQWIGWQWCRYLGRLSLTYLRWFQKRKHIFSDDTMVPSLLYGEQLSRTQRNQKCCNIGQEDKCSVTKNISTVRSMDCSHSKIF